MAVTKHPPADKTRLMAAVGSNIGKLRSSADLSRKEFAVAIGISEQALAKVEVGEQSPTMYTLYRIAMVLDCTLDDVVPVLAEVA